MKTVIGKTKCPCGADLHFELPKPSAITPMTVKIACEKCKSTFLVKAKVGLNRKIDVGMGVQKLSPETEALLQKQIDEQNLHSNGD